MACGGTSMEIARGSPSNRPAPTILGSNEGEPAPPGKICREEPISA